MIPVLHSIDTLLNRFDELSKCHTGFLSNFDINYPDIKNPLRSVTRTEEEQDKTNANLLLVVNDDRKESVRTIEDFHRRIVKNRYLHRPPVYSSLDNLSLLRVPSRTSSVTTDSTLFTRISQIRNTSQPNIQSKEKLTTITKPKVAAQNLSTQRSARSTITVFTMETVNRLARPKTYPQLPDQKPIIKYVQRRSKTYGYVKKETLKCSSLPSNPPLSIKRTKTTAIKPAPKKLKVEKKIPIQIQKSIPMRDFSFPIVFYAPIPTVCLAFPSQSQQKSSRTVILPKTITKNKRLMIPLRA
jgi:hypothetical protein